jgi:xylulokinase
VTVGVDIGTTSVKALAVDEDGKVVAASRVPHSVVAPEPDVLRHDARKAWRAGPRRAFAAVAEQVAAAGRGEVAGVAVASMVPSLTAVNRSGVPVLPGLLYGDLEGRPVEGGGAEGLPTGTMLDAEGFMRWAVAEAPGARGYWPCQGVATHALSGVAAIDTGVTASMGSLHSWG